MSTSEVDLDALDPKLRHAVLLSEIERLEGEQRDADERRAARESAEAQGIVDKIGSDYRESAERAARFATEAVRDTRAAIDKHVKRSADPALSDSEREVQRGLVAERLAQLDRFEAFERRAATRLVVSEPAVYGPNSPNSFFLDLASMHSPGSVGHRSAMDRIGAYGLGLQRDKGRAGVRAHRAWRERSRLEADFQEQSDRQYNEYRAMSSGGSSGGALIAPDYLTDQYSLWRSYVPAVAEACNTSVDLPTYGLTVNVPQDLSGAPVSVQSTENTDPGSSSFTGGYITAPVKTLFGYTEISQQLYDRSGPTKFDQVVYAQLRASLDATVDQTVIAALIAGATTNLTRATFTDMSSWWSDVNKAAASLETTAGTLLPATHAFLPPTNFRWFASQVDSEKRPIWTPDGSSAPDPDSGFTGYRIASTGVYTDGSIPTSSGNAQFLVANPGSTLLLCGQPYLQVFPGTSLAGQLSVIVRLYQYTAVVVRYPSAAATISGAAYPAAPTFA